MKPLRQRVLQLFREMKKDQLDLHVLFEAAGNDPTERREVLEALDELAREGLLEPRSGDFYALTEKGRRALR